MFDTIVLAVDGSENAKRAAQVVQDLAKRMDSQVIVVHAFDPLPRYLDSEQVQKSAARGMSHGTEIAEEVAEPLRAAGIDVELDVLEGPAAEAILRVARVRDADLIVMGSRGLSEMEAMFLGSVSHKVLQHAPCPALVVR